MKTKLQISPEHRNSTQTSEAPLGVDLDSLKCLSLCLFAWVEYCIQSTFTHTEFDPHDNLLR